MTDDIRCDAVPLARVAFIHAGLADGLSLNELLDHLDVDAATWGRAQASFARLFARRAREGNDFALRVDALSDVARSAWERKLPPLDQELAAFFDFERHYAASVDGLAFLRERRMRPSDLNRLERLWNERFAADSALREQALTRMAEEPGPCPDVQPEPPRLVQARAARLSRDATEQAKLPLPFIDGEANLAPPPLSTPLPARKKTGLDGTRDIGDLRSILASLPFARSVAPQPSAAPPTREPIATPVEAAAVIAPAVVQPVVAAVAPSVLPVTPPAYIAPQGPVRDLRGTSMAVDVPARAALPFAQGSSTLRSAGDAPAPPAEPPRPRAHSDLRETSAVFFAPRSQAMPFSTTAPAPPRADTSTLTVEQYASLCVDLAVDPGRAAETLRRYHLTPEQKQAIDAEWQARFARDATSWQAWDRAYKTYHAWIVGQRGKGP